MADAEICHRHGGWLRQGAVLHAAPAHQASLDYVLRRLGRGCAWVRPVQANEHADRLIESCLMSLGTTSPEAPDLADDSHSQTDPPADPSAWLAFQTSGSTGSSKTVLYRWESVGSHARAVIDALGIRHGHRYLALPSPRFAYGLSIVFSHSKAGVPVLFAEAGARLEDVTEWIAAPGGSLALYLLPQHVPMLLNAPIDPGRLERVFIAGGRISGPSVEALAKKFPNLRLTNMYGQAEMGPRLSVWDGHPKDFVEGSIGKPISGVQLKLTDEERGRTEPVPLMASSEHAMWKCLKPPYEEFEDGPAPGEFIDTGDLAMRAPDGGLIHCGRGDHVLNVAGTKIDVRRVTRLIEERFRPIVVRITSKPSRVAGDVLPVVEIVPSPGETITKRDVRQTLHADYGNLASLFDVLIVDQLNLGESGK